MLLWTKREKGDDRATSLQEHEGGHQVCQRRCQDRGGGKGTGGEGNYNSVRQEQEEKEISVRQDSHMMFPYMCFSLLFNNKVSTQSLKKIYIY